MGVSFSVTMPDGSTWVSGTPDFSHRKFSKGQKNHQRRFKEAAAYARDAAKKQPIDAELAKGTVKNAYNMALSDWFNPPVVRRIERRAGKIQVEASDNVMVARARVTILNEEGAILESGEAKPEDSQKGPSLAGWWGIRLIQMERSQPRLGTRQGMWAGSLKTEN